MKRVTTRELNRNTAQVLDGLERGETFELQRNGRTIGYLSQTAPKPEHKADWKAHFAWLQRQPITNDALLLAEFEAERRRLGVRTEDLEHPE